MSEWIIYVSRQLQLTEKGLASNTSLFATLEPIGEYAVHRRNIFIIITAMKSAIVLSLLLACSHPAIAQFNPGAPQTGLNAAMMKLFGDINAFSSRAQVRMLDQSGAESMSLPITLAMLDGKVRAEVDLSQVKSKEMSAEVAGSLKQLGMDKMVSIIRPDRKSVFYVYPSLQAYAETPMSKED